MANAAGWSTTDKNASITIADNNPYLGINSLMTQAGAASLRSGRSAWSASSGKWIVYMVPKTQSVSGNQMAMVGFSNAAASLTSYPGGTNDSWGIGNYGILHNASSAWNFGGFWNFYPLINPLFAIALNLDANPKRAHFRMFTNSNNSDPRSDTGWINASGTASDPTNSSSGTDISSLGAPIYIIGGGTDAGPDIVLNLNMGGWTPLTEFVPIPSGYSMPDANYPFAITAGSFTLSTTNPTNTTISQGGMRALITSGIGGISTNYSAQFPANSLTLNAVFWDLCGRGDASVGHRMIGASGTGTAVGWLNDGTTTGFSGAHTGPTWSAGQATYQAVNRATNKAWLTLDGITWWGNGGASPNPATGTNGADFSGIATGLSTLAPAIYLDTDVRPAGTWNAGRTIDPFSVPPGFRWLDSGGILRARVSMG